MNNIILLTTAISRGNLHKKSIHLFYEKFIKYLDCYCIHHIINIDYPEKIKPLFFRNDTIELFEEINYINFFPDILEDIGIQFIKKHGLEKSKNSYK